MINKYNVRAIRDELDGYIRHHAWRKFRKRFMDLLPVDNDGGVKEDIQKRESALDLCRAVIEYKRPQTKAMRGQFSGSLLHTLCYRFNSSPEHPVPFDLIEIISKTCPKLLSVSHGKKNQTPLAILLDRGASPLLVEHIVALGHHNICNGTNSSIHESSSSSGRRDRKKGSSKMNANQSMHLTHRQPPTTTQSILCLKDCKGDTPLLHAVRYWKDVPELVHVLVKGCGAASTDTTMPLIDRSSLLIPSKKGKIPLFYVVQEEMKDETYEIVDGQTTLPAHLLYLLLETQRAVETLQDRTRRSSNETIDDLKIGISNIIIDNSLGIENSSLTRRDAAKEKTHGIWSSDCSEDSSDSYLSDSEWEEYNYLWPRLLHSAIACAHFLDEKTFLKLFRVIFSQMQDDDFLLYVDNEENQNTLVHCICRAHESKSFLQILDDDGGGRGVLETLIERGPELATKKNADGHTPLQLAIQMQKGFELLLALIRAEPMLVHNSSGIESEGTLQPRLPLQMMLVSWDHSFESSKCPRRRFYTDNEILHVHKLCPDALLVADQLTKLYPFQMAVLGFCHTVVGTPQRSDHPVSRNMIDSSSSSNSCQEMNDADDCTASSKTEHAAEVSLVYQLLRVAPQVLQFLPTTADKK